MQVCEERETGDLFWNYNSFWAELAGCPRLHLAFGSSKEFFFFDAKKNRVGLYSFILLQSKKFSLEERHLG